MMTKSGTTPKIAAVPMLALMVAAAPIAFAQTAVGVPTRDEIEREIIDQATRDQPKALTVDDGIERAPCLLAGPEYTDIKFTLRSAQFNGLGGIDPATLSESYSSLVGQEVSVSTICDIRDRAATTLRQQGYLAAVQVPPQKIESGTVTFDVLMAKLTDIRVRGNAGPSEKLLQRYLEKITNQPVFNINEAERYLLLARDIPGLDVRLALRPTEGLPGAVIGEFSVIRTPIYADINIQNLGSREVGRFAGLARVRVNGITGLGDETTISGFTTADFKEQFILQASHDMRLGGEGFKLGLNFTHAWTKPTVAGGANIRSKTLIAGINGSYPFIRSQAQNLIGTLGYEYIDQDSRLGNIPLSRDKLSIAYARLEYGATDRASISGRNGYSLVEPKFQFNGSLEARHGLDIFGASNGCGPALALCALPGAVPPTRAEGDPTSLVLRARGNVDYRPDPLLTFSLSARAQQASNPLFAFEEISGGNYTIGRGYDPGTIIGDSGIALQAEVKYGSAIPQNRDAIAWQPFLFLDSAWVWNEDLALAAFSSQNLVSAGGGLRVAIGDRARIDATVAVPLKRAGFQTRRGDVRGLFTLTVQLAPWRR